MVEALEGVHSPLSASQLSSSSNIGEMDARELQLMLYREIGIAAVAAALAVTREEDQPSPSLSATHDLATHLLANDKAA